MFRFGFSEASFLLYRVWIRCFGVFKDVSLRNWFHCKSPALRVFLPCALGMQELSLRTIYMEPRRCIQAINPFPKEDVYSLTGSFKDGKSGAKQAGDSPFPVTGVRIYHRGFQRPPNPARLGTPMGDVLCATITNLICSAEVLLSTPPSASSLVSLGNSHKECNFFLLSIFSKWLNSLDADGNCGTNQVEIPLLENSDCLLFNGEKPGLIIAALWDYVFSQNYCPNSARSERERRWGSGFRSASTGEKLVCVFWNKTG